MWEITLSGKYDDIVYLLEMERVLKDKYNREIISVVWVCDDVICNLATTNNLIVDNIKEIVIETLLKIAKTKFFTENLNIFTNDSSINTFLISSLTMVDLEEEIDFTLDNMQFNNYINIQSFINFKFFQLRARWKYLIDYINYSFSKSIGDNVFLDFLKFLTDLQTSKCEALYLEKNELNIELYDSKHNKIKSLSSTDEIGMVVNLIMLSPKKIIINCIDELSNKTSNLMSYIFDEKLSFLL